MVRTQIMDRPLAQRTIEALRFSVTNPTALHIEQAILLADTAYQRSVAAFERSSVAKEASDRVLSLGQRGTPTDHRHAHWIPLANPAGVVTDLLIWVPARLTDTEAQVIKATMAEPLTTESSPRAAACGLPRTELQLTASGDIADIAGDLCGPSKTWTTTTPYLTVTHWHQREPFADHLTADAILALAHRQFPVPTQVVAVDEQAAGMDAWAARFRRYRVGERSDRRRQGLGLRVTFAEEITGPVIFGRLSHFGYGLFMPTPQD